MDTQEKIEGTLYRSEPGDMTRYTFFVSELNEAHTNIISGVSQTPDNYLLIGIKMTGGTGFGVLSKKEIATLIEEPDYYPIVSGYAKGHGFRNVHDYTLKKVLFTIAFLLNGYDVETAGRKAKEIMQDGKD